MLVNARRAARLPASQRPMLLSCWSLPGAGAERARPLRPRTEAGNYFIAASYIFATYSQFTR